MKLTLKVLALIILICPVFRSLAQSTVQIDITAKGGPDITYKRGVAAPGVNGFFDSQQTRDFLDYQKSIGMTMFNGIRNIYKDVPTTNEFYQESGMYKNQQISKFTDIRIYAKNVGFEMISQVGGTPTNSGYEIDPNYICSCEDFAPLPSPGTSMKEYQRNFSEWAINADKAVDLNFHSIWIGTQEITHTIGFVDDNSTDAAKKLNIRRFVDYWKPISDSLRNAGAKTGGLQMNSSTENLYQYAVDYMKQQDLHLDFLTHQFYQWGDTTDLSQAVLALNSYNQTYPGTKIIVDRGGADKLIPADLVGKSGEVIYHLVAEEGMMNFADKIYAYTLDRSINGIDNVKNTLLWLTKTWINTLPNKRRPISGFPAGVDGFVTSDGNNLKIAIWNRGATTRTVNIKINGSNYSADANLLVRKASDQAFTNVAATFDTSTQTISSISLAQYDYVLIDLIGSPNITTGDFLFQQNFNSSSNLNEFINSSNLVNTQFTGKNTGANASITIEDSKLALKRNFPAPATGNGIGITRTGLDNNSLLKISFKYQLSSANGVTNTMSLLVGQDFLAGNSVPQTDDKVHSRIAFSGTTNLDEFTVNTPSANAVAGTGLDFAGPFRGQQTITMYINNLDADYTYAGPNTVQNRSVIAKDTYDLWVGNTRVLQGRAALTASVNNLNSFGFYGRNISDASSTSYIDDIYISLEANILTKEQAIIFPPIETKYPGDADLDSPATATSGLEVSYSSSDTMVAVVYGSKIKIVGIGECIITAYQSGNAEYLPADSVSQLLTVNKRPQSIAFDSIPQKTFGEPDFSILATADSGLPVSFSSSNTEIATVTEGNVHITGIGRVIITASQLGNDTYAAASVNRTLDVAPDTEAPSIPSGLAGNKLNRHKVELTWVPSTDNIGVIGYYVYINGVQDTSLIAGTNYLSERPIGNDLYVFTVRGVDAAGNLSSESSSVIVSNGNTKDKSMAKTFNSDVLEVSPASGISIYPNPSQGNFTVNVNTPENGAITISVFNTSGVLIQSVKDVKNGSYQKDIALNGLSVGTYIVQVSVSTFIRSKTILIN